MVIVVIGKSHKAVLPSKVMVENGSKYSHPTEDEREKQVLDLYFNKRLSYGKIAHQLRMSLRDITRIIKKAKGEPVPSSNEENQQSPPQVQPENNFREMYRRFLEGQLPLQVAIALNLRVEYVSEVYIGYLNSIGLSAVTRLVQEEGYEGLEIVRSIANILKDYKIKPKDYGPVISYMRHYYDGSMSLEEQRKKSDTLNSKISISMNELAKMGQQKSRLQAEVRELSMQVEQKSAELTQVPGEADMLSIATPESAWYNWLKRKQTSALG